MHFKKLIYLKMKTIIAINLLITMLALINAQAIYQVHSQYKSICDSETGTELGRAIIESELIGNETSLNETSSSILFNITLQDNNHNEYQANCKIENSDDSNSSYCLFDPPNEDTKLFFKSNSLVIIEGIGEIQFSEDFYIDARGCHNEEDDNPTNSTDEIPEGESTENITDYVVDINSTINFTDELPEGESIENITDYVVDINSTINFTDELPEGESTENITDYVVDINSTINFTDELPERESTENITDYVNINVTDEFSENFTFASDEMENNTNQTTSNITEAEEKLNINLSFRQINFFVFYNYQITFKFFGLTTFKFEKGYEISLFLYLMFKDGTLDSKLTEAKCILDENVNPLDGQAQADFS